MVSRRTSLPNGKHIDRRRHDQLVERRSPAPDSGNMRRLANALGIRPEEIALPRGEIRWLSPPSGSTSPHVVKNLAGGFSVAGWDHGDAVDWPLRAVDPDYPDNDSPYIMTYGG